MYTIIAVGPLYLPPYLQIPGTFVMDYDPDYNHGEGRAWFTNDVKKARKFETLEHAQAYSMRPSESRSLICGDMVNQPLVREFSLLYRELIPKDPFDMQRVQMQFYRGSRLGMMLDAQQARPPMSQIPPRRTRR